MSISSAHRVHSDPFVADRTVIDLTEVHLAHLRQPASAPTGRDLDVFPGAILDLVIPALNEERRIGKTLDELADLIGAESLPVRLIVVDNGSVDGTAAVVESRRREGLAVEMISCRFRGKGAAIRRGVMHATAPFVGYCDADLPVPAESLKWALDLLRSGWEVVVGSRRCFGARYVVRQSVPRRLGGAAFRLASSGMRGPIRDTQCGFKFFERTLAQRLVNDLTVNAFAFDVELLARALHEDARLIELPLPWTDQPGSTFRAGTDGVKAFWELHTARRSLRRWQAQASV